MSFVYQHPNGGKWSQPEEFYAAALIDAFKGGTLPEEDIEEGMSLFAWLSFF